MINQKHEAGRLRGFLCCHAPYLVEGSQGICGSTSWMADGLLRLRRSSKKLSMVGLGGDGGEWRVAGVGGEGGDDDEGFQARGQVDHEGGA